MSREKIIEAIQAATENNRLPCGKAHALAEELKISLREIGKICDELKIRISDCQLGCF